MSGPAFIAGYLDVAGERPWDRLRVTGWQFVSLVESPELTERCGTVLIHYTDLESLDALVKDGEGAPGTAPLVRGIASVRRLADEGAAQEHARKIWDALVRYGAPEGQAGVLLYTGAAGWTHERKDWVLRATGWPGGAPRFVETSLPRPPEGGPNQEYLQTLRQWFLAQAHPAPRSAAGVAARTLTQMRADSASELTRPQVAALVDLLLDLEVVRRHQGPLPLVLRGLGQVGTIPSLESVWRRVFPGHDWSKGPPPELEAAETPGGQHHSLEAWLAAQVEQRRDTWKRRYGP